MRVERSLLKCAPVPNRQIPYRGYLLVLEPNESVLVGLQVVDAFEAEAAAMIRNYENWSEVVPEY